MSRETLKQVKEEPVQKVENRQSRNPKKTFKMTAESSIKIQEKFRYRQPQKEKRKRLNSECLEFLSYNEIERTMKKQEQETQKVEEKKERAGRLMSPNVAARALVNKPQRGASHSIEASRNAPLNPKYKSTLSNEALKKPPHTGRTNPSSVCWKRDLQTIKEVNKIEKEMEVTNYSRSKYARRA